MKIRNHRKLEWWYFPHKTSKLRRGSCYIFKYKSDLMRFLNNNLKEAVNGEVRLEESSFGHSGCIREWVVWYNEQQHRNGGKQKIDLRQLDFRGRKYIFKPSKISKESKRYFAFSDKVISLMCHIEDDNGTILSKDAIRLTNLFYKRGFKDFVAEGDDLDYINNYVEKGIDFSYWSDRCNWLRTKTIIEYFKANNLFVEK